MGTVGNHVLARSKAAALIAKPLVHEVDGIAVPELILSAGDERDPLIEKVLWTQISPEVARLGFPMLAEEAGPVEDVARVELVGETATNELPGVQVEAEVHGAEELFERHLA